MASLRFRLRQTYWRWAAPGKIRGYMERNSVRKLQIGTGTNLLPGWLNTTLYPFTPGSVFLDASQAFPIPDNSFDYVFSEHVIEHLEFEQAEWMLKESCRILRPGGRIRIATPDLRQIIALYTQPEHEEQQSYIRWIMDTFRPQIGEYNPAQAINQSFHGWRHKFIYDEDTLVQSMVSAGLADIKRVKPGESEDEHLRAIEQHGEYVGSDAAMRYETMVLEAIKAGQG